MGALVHPGVASLARRRPRHRLDRRLARRGADHGARRRRRARAGHPRGRPSLRAGQPRRARQPARPRHHRRRARGRAAPRARATTSSSPSRRTRTAPASPACSRASSTARPRRGSATTASSCSGCRPTTSTRRPSAPSTPRSRRCSPTSRPGSPRSRTCCSSPASSRSATTSTQLRARIAEEPWKTALVARLARRRSRGRVRALRGQRRLRARHRRAREATTSTPTIMTLVEFGFARGPRLPRAISSRSSELRDAAVEHGYATPRLVDGTLDRALVAERALSMLAADWRAAADAARQRAPPAYAIAPPPSRSGKTARSPKRVAEWRAQDREPDDSIARAALAESLADAGDARRRALHRAPAPDARRRGRSLRRALAAAPGTRRRRRRDARARVRRRAARSVAAADGARRGARARRRGRPRTITPPASGCGARWPRRSRCTCRTTARLRRARSSPGSSTGRACAPSRWRRWSRTSPSTASYWRGACAATRRPAIKRGSRRAREDLSAALATTSRCAFARAASGPRRRSSVSRRAWLGRSACAPRASPAEGRRRSP